MPLRLLPLLTLLSPVACQAGIAVLGSLAQEHVIARGEAFQGVIILHNTGSEMETARVYQTDYSFKADGSNDFGPPGQLPRSNADWLAPSTSLVRIPPNGTAVVNYSGRVPRDTTLTGSYWSILMIEATTPMDSDPAAPGLKVLARYGVQVSTHIGSTGTRGVRFVKRELVREEAGARLLIDIENDSERLVLPRLWVELYDASGKKAGRFGGEVTRIYPSCAARYRIELPGLPSGEYHALILADCGDDQMVGTQCSLVL